MNYQESVKLFEGRKVRSVWGEGKEKWYYSVVDVIGILCESSNPNNYWKVLKNRLKSEGNQLVTNCNQLKLLSSDGKYYKTDVADTEQLMQLIQYISSPKTESFLLWLGYLNQSGIENRIYTIRGVQVMLDSHLAELYHIETKYINKAVKRNIERFPDSFMFILTESEFENLRFQFGTSKEQGGRRYLPIVFTEQGVAMLSAVLHSDAAVKISIRIIQAFVEMRKMILNNASLYQRVDKLEIKLHEADDKFEYIFKALESKTEKPDKGIFFEGQVFDAWKFISDLIRSAKSSVILIDNYIDDRVLQLLIKREQGVTATIYSSNISKQLTVDLEKHNSQYEQIVIKEFNASHDRFLIIDEKELYHIGASLKDLGKKWFAFSMMKDTLILDSVMNNLATQVNE